MRGERYVIQNNLYNTFRLDGRTFTYIECPCLNKLQKCMYMYMYTYMYMYMCHVHVCGCQAALP